MLGFNLNFHKQNSVCWTVGSPASFLGGLALKFINPFPFSGLVIVYKLGVHIYLVLTQKFINPFPFSGLMIVYQLGVHIYLVLT